VRTTDYVARYGGEEFVVILPETTADKANELAERLRKKTAELKIDSKGNVFSITISLGIAVFPEHGQNYDEILEKADAAMYQAKQNGRNRVCLLT
jgi:diguanylate cyclase (GGDEF)-like protein